MKTFRWFCGLAAAVLLTAGCRTSEVLRSDFSAACSAAAARRKLPRTVEFMEVLADRHVGRESQLTRLAAAEREDFSSFSAENDPRFMWALEVGCWCRMLLLPERFPAAGPEAQVEPVVLRLLEFEQAVWWAKLDLLKDAPASDLDKEACLLALELTTGWSRERIMSFDFSSLPRPGRGENVPPDGADDPGRSVAGIAAELLTLASQVPPPERSVIEERLASLDRARRALARRYLLVAERRWERSPDAPALAKWRIARARWRLENAEASL